MTDPIEAACVAYYANEVLLAKRQGHPLRTPEWRELDDDYKHEYRESMRAAITDYRDAETEALQRQLADCRADAERLDKLQDLFIKGDEFHIVMCAGENDDEECEHDAHPHFEAFDWSWRCEAVRSNTLRDVIDQAIDKARHD